MTDEDIIKIASRLAKSLATKDDIKDVRKDIKNLEKKIDILDSKADSIMEFADEVDKTTSGHEKRLKEIEAIPAIAHQIRK